MARVLVVEDNILTAECLQRWLQLAGHTVQYARDAQAALDCIDNTVPQVIVLDLLLLGASGVQLLHTLQSHADLANIPVIVCSNAVPHGISAAYGVRAVLLKPSLTRKKLCAAVQEVLAHAAV